MEYWCASSMRMWTGYLDYNVKTFGRFRRNFVAKEATSVPVRTFILYGAPDRIRTE